MNCAIETFHVDEINPFQDWHEGIPIQSAPLIPRE
jgi:hypothetical protein